MRASHPPKRKLIASIIIVIVLMVGSYVLGLGGDKFNALMLLGAAIRDSILPAPALDGQADGRTNILLFGLTQDGLRTDTIILASYYWQQRKLVTLSLPRDLYIYDGYQQSKLGEVYAHAKTRQPTDHTYPDTYTTSLIGHEYGIPIHYWAEINLQGAADLINAVGGVNVTVPRSFTDYQYPNNDYSGYIRPAPHFAAGPQHLDGDTALIFARSRHSLDNSEGTDFARSKRQALIIQGVLERLKERGPIANLASTSDYLGILSRNVTTNLSSGNLTSLAKQAQKLDPGQDYIRASWETGNGFLCDAKTTDGAYIIVYGQAGDCRTGTMASSQYYEQARSYVQDLLTRASQPQTSTQP